MTPAALAALHARVFTMPPPWSAAQMAGILASPGVRLLSRPGGFLIGRVVADEAEVLTLAVAPEARRRGLGAALLAGFLAQARAEGASRAFLEVAAGNAAALALYRRAGFAEAGRRRGYFRSADGRREDALVLALPLGPAGPVSDPPGI